MTKPFKFRYLNELVGAFVLLVIALLAGGIYLAAKSQGWFVPVSRVYTLFPDEGAFGLKEGAEVRLFETVVGTVEEIVPTEDGEIKGVFKIKGPFMQYVREDSVAIIKKIFELGGGSFVQITQGIGEELPEEDPFIPCLRDAYLLESVHETVQQIREKTIPVIEQLQVTLESYTTLANQLSDRESPLQKLLVRLEHIATGIDQGQGAAGKLLRDEDVAQAMEDIIMNLNQASSHLLGVSKTISKESEDLPRLMDQTQETLREAEVLIEGLERHWLVRKYMEQEPEGPIPPSVLSGSGGAGR